MSVGREQQRPPRAYTHSDFGRWGEEGRDTKKAKRSGLGVAVALDALHCCEGREALSTQHTTTSKASAESMDARESEGRGHPVSLTRNEKEAPNFSETHTHTDCIAMARGI